MEDKAKDQSVSGDGAVYGKEIKAHIEEHLGKIRYGFQEKWGDRSSPHVLFVRATLEPSEDPTVEPLHRSVVLGDLNGPLSFSLDGKTWKEVRGADSLPETGVSFWREGISGAASTDTLRDPVLEEQLKALGYLDG